MTVLPARPPRSAAAAPAPEAVDVSLKGSSSPFGRRASDADADSWESREHRASALLVPTCTAEGLEARLPLIEAMQLRPPPLYMDSLKNALDLFPSFAERAVSPLMFLTSPSGKARARSPSPPPKPRIPQGGPYLSRMPKPRTLRAIPADGDSQGRRDSSPGAFRMRRNSCGASGVAAACCGGSSGSASSAQPPATARVSRPPPGENKTWAEAADRHLQVPQTARAWISEGSRGTSVQQRTSVGRRPSRFAPATLQARSESPGDAPSWPPSCSSSAWAPSQAPSQARRTTTTSQHSANPKRASPHACSAPAPTAAAAPPPIALPPATLVITSAKPAHSPRERRPVGFLSTTHTSAPPQIGMGGTRKANVISPRAGYAGGGSATSKATGTRHRGDGRGGSSGSSCDGGGASRPGGSGADATPSSPRFVAVPSAASRPTSVPSPGQRVPSSVRDGGSDAVGSPVPNLEDGKGALRPPTALSGLSPGEGWSAAAAPATMWAPAAAPSAAAGGSSAASSAAASADDDASAEQAMDDPRSTTGDADDEEGAAVAVSSAAGANAAGHEPLAASAELVEVDGGGPSDGGEAEGGGGIPLQPSTMLAPGFGSRRFQLGVHLLSTSKLTQACEVFLAGLVRAPDDELMERGFRAGHERYKIFPAARWSRWPFNDRQEEQETGPSVNEVPGGMPPTSMVTRTPSTIEVGWPAYEVRADVPSDRADGYVLESASLCPISGPADWNDCQWKRAYKGNKCSYTFRGCTLHHDVLVRVRAFNAKGGGAWSVIGRYRVEKPPPPARMEHPDIPQSWYMMDIEDVVKSEGLMDEPELRTLQLNSLFSALHAHRSKIKVAFRYYSLMGGSSSKDDDADSMTMSQFLNFVRAAKLLDYGVIPSDVDRMFVRSIRDLDRRAVAAAPSAAPAAAPAAAAPSDSEWKKAKGAVKAVSVFKTQKGGVMYQQHFVGGLVRLANVCFNGARPNVAERVDMLIDQVLAPHVDGELDLLHDAFSRLMELQPMRAVYGRRRAECDRVFIYYSAADKSLEHVRHSTTMNIREMAELCDDAGLYDAKFGVRSLVDAFGRVNIEDDVYVQTDKANTSTELVADEFFEVLARMYHTRWAGGSKQRSAKKLIEGESEDAGLELARGFDAWLQESFLPAANSAIKTRKKAGLT